MTGITNALSETTTLNYDSVNRLKKITFADAKFVEYTYDLAGRRTAVKDALGNTTNYGYDQSYRLTSVTDPLNHTTAFGYDLMSNLTSRTDALGNATNYEYDAFDRLKKIVYPPATIGGARLGERFEYDAVGNLKKRVDTASRETLYDYDAANRLLKITDANLKLTEFQYNARSQMTRVTDALNQVYDFTYDALGRQLSQTRAGTTMSYEYDAVGNRTKRTDYLNRPTAYEYDQLNRLKKIEYLPVVVAGASPSEIPNLQSTFNYDALSRLVTATNEAGTVSFTFDTRGRLQNETDVFNHTVSYGYDGNGNRVLLKLDNTDYASYVYDADNRLTALTNISDNAQITFAYDAANRLTSRTFPNNVTTTFEYDGMSRLTRLKDVGTSNLFDRQYSYNAANQIQQITELNSTRTFSYDNLDRLLSVTNTAGTNETYAFDAVGNRTSSHRSANYSYEPFNKLTASSTNSFAYDANGNLRSKSGGGEFWRYGWDYENRLTSASTRKQSVRYSYDALGRRVSRTGKGAAGTSQTFTYDGADVLLDDSLGVQTKYLNGLGIDNKLRQTANGQAQYFLSDHLGSTNALTDNNGAIVSQTAYDSFGNQTGNLSIRYGFTGRERDDFTGLMFYRARWYSQDLGRFISNDPLGFAAGDINLYAYVGNRPTNSRDPFGLYDYAMYENPKDLDKAIYELGFKPHNFQCGPSPYNPLSRFVRDRIGGLPGYLGYFGNMYDLKPACVKHDFCWGDCSKSREECDNQFRKDLHRICDEPGPGRSEYYRQQCKSLADSHYYNAVSDQGFFSYFKPGKAAFEDSQKHSNCNQCGTSK